MLLFQVLFQEKAITVADLFGVRVTGPLQAHARDFSEQLTKLGYTRLSAADQLRLMAHQGVDRIRRHRRADGLPEQVDSTKSEAAAPGTASRSNS